MTPGIAIQAPWSGLILTGKKTIETRFYPLSSRYAGKKLAIIETPPKPGAFKSRVVGWIVFDSCFKYNDETAFDADRKRHLVPKTGPFSWVKGKHKWGWRIKAYGKLRCPVQMTKPAGRIYTRDTGIQL